MTLENKTDQELADDALAEMIEQAQERVLAFTDEYAQTTRGRVALNHWTTRLEYCLDLQRLRDALKVGITAIQSLLILAEQQVNPPYRPLMKERAELKRMESDYAASNASILKMKGNL